MESKRKPSLTLRQSKPCRCDGLFEGLHRRYRRSDCFKSSSSSFIESIVLIPKVVISIFIVIIIIMTNWPQPLPSHGWSRIYESLIIAFEDGLCALQMIMRNHRENHHSSLWRRAWTLRLPHHLALLPPHHRLLAAVSLLCHQGGPGELIILGHRWSLLLLFWFNHIPQSWKQEYFIQWCATFRSKSNNEKHFATLRIWHLLWEGPSLTILPLSHLRNTNVQWFSGLEDYFQVALEDQVRINCQLSKFIRLSSGSHQLSRCCLDSNMETSTDH